VRLVVVIVVVIVVMCGVRCHKRPQLFLRSSLIARITKRPSWPRIGFCNHPWLRKSQSGRPGRTFY